MKNVNVGVGKIHIHPPGLAQRKTRFFKGVGVEIGLSAFLFDSPQQPEPHRI